MQIAPYYKSLFHKAVIAAKNMEPITFIGMSDSGVDYLFNLAESQILSKLDKLTVTFLIDLSGSKTSNQVIQEVYQNTKIFVTYSTPPLNISEIASAILKAVKAKKLIMLVYLGQDKNTPREIFEIINTLRNKMGWNFSYIIFGNTKIVNQYLGDSISEKVLFRHHVAVKLLDRKNSSIVIDNYEKRYDKKLSLKNRNNIIQNAGGNPGLLKALYLSTISEIDDIENDSGLTIRLKNIWRDLNDSQKKYLLNKSGNLPAVFLRKYSYIDSKGEIFSPIFDRFTKSFELPTNKDESVNLSSKSILLTKQQRKLFDFLSKNRAQIISRDQIAEILWGDRWNDKYSDWAIDQAISTLRKQLQKFKLPGKIISKKGEGILFVSEK